MEIVETRRPIIYYNNRGPGATKWVDGWKSLADTANLLELL